MEKEMTAEERHLAEIKRVRKLIKRTDGFVKKDLIKYLNRLQREYREYKRLFGK